MRQGWKQLAIAVAVVAGTAGHDAAAAVCFPYAGGVPGATGSGPPNWWSAGSAPTGSSTVTFLEDPRWRGAFADIWGSERFRVVVENSGGTEYLVMSWQVSGDPGGAGDLLYFGVWDDATSTGNIYQLTRRAASATTVPDGGAWTSSASTTAFDGRIFGGRMVSGSPVWTDLGTALPTWLTADARVDVSSCSAPGSCDSWAFRIRAKIDPMASTSAATPSGIKISGSTFHFWYEIQDDLSAGASAVAAFPNGLGVVSGTPPAFPNWSGWAQAKLGSTGPCDGNILFSSSDVYVNAVGSTTLNLTSNEFHAKPRNNVPSSSISTSDLTANFRIANWGSAGFNSPEWVTTCPAGGSGPLVPYPDAFDLSCTWTGFNACPYQPTGSCDGGSGTKDPHQCVLVDLGVSGTRHYTFSSQSVYKNMDFDVNSTLVRQATIDIKGFGPMPGGAANRDVYLYVHTNNMPAKIADEPPPPPASDKDTDRRGNVLPPRQRFKELQLPATGAIGTKDSARIQTAVQAGNLTMDQVEQIMPTYIVYVWHDTGRTITTAAGTRKLLEQQPSFGLFLAHDGPIEGWKHELTAAGAVQIGPNFFKISAPNESTFPVTITIQPIQPTRLWWLWILLALALVLVLYLLFRKKP